MAKQGKVRHRLKVFNADSAKSFGNFKAYPNTERRNNICSMASQAHEGLHRAYLDVVFLLKKAGRSSMYSQAALA